MNIIINQMDFFLLFVQFITYKEIEEKNVSTAYSSYFPYNLLQFPLFLFVELFPPSTPSIISFAVYVVYKCSYLFCSEKFIKKLKN